MTTTPELHIVVEAISANRMAGAFQGYKVRTAPLTWEEALAKWETFRSTRFAVRSVNDPRFADLVQGPFKDTVNRRTGNSRPGTGRIKAAKAWAHAHGYNGAAGGWIYNKNDRAICQGWDTFASYYCAAIQNGADGWYVLSDELAS
jgi:hypothetical protein